MFVDVAVHVDGGGRGTGTRLRRGSSEPAFDRGDVSACGFYQFAKVRSMLRRAASSIGLNCAEVVYSDSRTPRSVRVA